MPIKEITIQPHFVLIGGALMDLGKVWRGSIQDMMIQLCFIGGGNMEFYCDDGSGSIPVNDSAIILEPNLFHQLRGYLKVNLKPIEII